MNVSNIKLRTLRIKDHIVCTDDFITRNYEIPRYMIPRLSWKLKNGDINKFFYSKKRNNCFGFF